LADADAAKAELAKRKASEPKNENPATPGNPAIQPKSEASAKPESVPRETVPQLVFDKKTADIRGNGNLPFDITDENGKKIGRISLNEREDLGGYQVENVSIDEGSRGQGWGVETYKGIIDHFDKPIFSDKSRTPEVERVWKSLERQGYAKYDKDLDKYVSIKPKNEIPATPETGNEILKKDLNSAIQPENATSAEMKPGTNPPVESPGSQEIGTSKVETPITETPATGKVSKAARDINNSLVEQGFDELPASELAKYTPITKKETTERVTNLISDDPDLARKAATGQEAMPSDIHPQVLFNAVKNKAIQDGDVNLQRDLAKSPIATERSVAAQTLGASGFDNNPLKADLVTAMQEVGKARIEATAKKLGGEKNLKTTKEIVVKQIKAEITKKIPTKMDWSQFIESIQC